MIWFRERADKVSPALDSLRRTASQPPQQQTEIPQNDYQHNLNWKITASMISVGIFFILLCITIIGIPIVLTYIKHDSNCVSTIRWRQPPPFKPLIPGKNRLCAEKAIWNPRGVTVAGLSNGLPSASFAGLQYPYDIYVYDNGTILVADFMNDRITKWDPNATVGVLIAGTSSYGSWSTLLARPMALAVRDDYLYVADSENYRIEIFPLNSNMSSPDGVTLIGRYGQGTDLNQINQVTSIITPTTYPSLLYICDSKNHRILLWNSDKNTMKLVAGQSCVSGSDSTSLSNPFGITLDETTNSLYIADTSNNRIQKHDMNRRDPIITVAGWGELNNPHAVQLDPSGNNMFIADTYNHRILVWSNRATKGRIIAGNATAGNSVFQLNNPTQIRFDSNYNLYVVDTNNSRIQRFDLISNGC